MLGEALGEVLGDLLGEALGEPLGDFDGEPLGELDGDAETDNEPEVKYIVTAAPQTFMVNCVEAIPYYSIVTPFALVTNIVPPTPAVKYSVSLMNTFIPPG